MANASPEDYMDFLSSSWCETRFVEFTVNTELAAIAVVDHLNNALSAVYTFFDPKFSHLSPGRYAILWQIDYAQQLGVEWLYLGYWIGQCQKMSYKNQYRPVQAFIDKQWLQFEKDQSMDN
jgi:arginine-tRNA-protein transferase